MNTPVKYELAKLLKEKGFDTPTNRYYEHALTSKKDYETNDYKGAFGWKKGETNLQTGYCKNNDGMSDLSNSNWYICSTPTISEVVMWLYEKYGVWISVKIFSERFIFSVSEKVDTMGFDRFESEIRYNSPTEAYEEAIKYCLENII